MINLTHCDDGKGKCQSHEISISESDFYNPEHDVFSHNPFDITGYGATKEEAIEDFKRKFEYILAEWNAFEKYFAVRPYRSISLKSIALEKQFLPVLFFRKMLSLVIYLFKRSERRKV